MTQGIIVGCDLLQQWMLPWWWSHYSAHNTYPVAFIDFGMSKEARQWCEKRGQCLPLPKSHLPFSKIDIPVFNQKLWESKYGKRVWLDRQAWFKKPFGLLQCPFSVGIWIDVDCQVQQSLDSLFHYLSLGTDIAISRETYPDWCSNKQDEKQYNSGVIAFRKDAPILQQWADLSMQEDHIFAGDQEVLSHIILHDRPHLIELPNIYNASWICGPKSNVVIRHFYGGNGKIEILKNFIPQNPIELLLLSQSGEHLGKHPSYIENLDDSEAMDFLQVDR